MCAGVNGEGKEVFLKDVWPSKEEVQHVEEHMVIASIFTELRGRMQVNNGAVWFGGSFKNPQLAEIAYVRVRRSVVQLVFKGVEKEPNIWCVITC